MRFTSSATTPWLGEIVLRERRKLVRNPREGMSTAEALYLIEAEPERCSALVAALEELSPAHDNDPQDIVRHLGALYLVLHGRAGPPHDDLAVYHEVAHRLSSCRWLVVPADFPVGEDWFPPDLGWSDTPPFEPADGECADPDCTFLFEDEEADTSP